MNKDHTITKKTRQPKEVFLRLCLVGLISAMVLGNLFSVPALSVLGVVPTFYRCMLAFLTLFYLLRRIARKAAAPLTRIFWAAAAVMLFWLLYAAAQLYLIPGIDLREGIKDMMALFLGLCCIYCLCEANTNADAFRLITLAVRILAAALLVLALFEIATGLHLPTSRFNDPAFLESDWYVSRYGSSYVLWHTATGPYYNQNDFALLLALLSPFFLPQKDSSRTEKILCYTGLAMIFTMLIMCGSFIVTIAMLAGMLVLLLITKAGLVKHAFIWSGAVFIQLFLSKCIYALLIRIYSLISGFVSSLTGGKPLYDAFDETQTLGDALTDQVGNLLEKRGSLYYRLNIYKDGIKAFFTSRGLGLGPGGFTEYFTRHPSVSGLVNPHNWWLEVLAQYGFPVFAAYAALLLYTFIKTLRLYHETRFWGYAFVAAIYVIFAVGCIAPSGLLRFPFLWLPVALCISMLRPDYVSKAEPSLADAL